MARYQITLSQSSWSGGTAAIWYDTDAEACYDASTGGNVVTSVTVPTRSGYTFLGFGLTSPYYRCVDENGNIFGAKVKELFNTASTAVSGSLSSKTLSVYQAQTSTISGTTATIRTITIASTYWKGAPAKLYYSPAEDKFYLEEALSTEITGDVTAARECWTYSGCYAGSGPQYVSSTPAKSGDQYIDAEGDFTDELRIRGKVQTSFTINPRGDYFSYKVVFDPNGGSTGDSGVTAIYRPVSATGTYYTTDACTAGTEITALTAAQLPYLDSKVFGGFTGTKVTTASGAATATYYADRTGALNIANLDALTFSTTNQSLGKVTVYARWVPVCAITVNKGTNGTNAALPLATFYADTVNGGFYSDSALSAAITNIGTPTNECYIFTGCYDAAAGSTQYVNAAGDILAAFSIAEYTSTFTIYCKWLQTSWRVIFNKSGGAGGTDAIYRSVSDGSWYLDPLAASGSTSPISALTPPTRDGYIFSGYFASSSATSTKLVERNGALISGALAALTPSGTTPPSVTAYAVWQQLRTVTIGMNATSATVGADNVSTATPGDPRVFYSSTDAAYYADNNATEEVGISGRPLALPSVRCHACTGIWSSATSGDQKFDDTGLVVSGATAPSSSTTWYAQWTRISYVLILDANGGEGGTVEVFQNGDNNAIYSDDELATEISGIAPPTRTGYTFLGYFSAQTGGTRIFDDAGNVAIATSFGSRDATLYARWQANTYTLSFSGAGEISPVSVTYGSAIGDLPAPSAAVVPANAQFNGWLVDGLPISSSTVWTWAEDKTALPNWRYAFGDVEDYFGLAKPWLIPFESDEGLDRPRIVTRAYGKAKGADESSSLQWRNPTVRYMVVADGELSVKLGTAFAAVTGKTGYMITAAVVDTQIGSFPVVTISGVATEGRNAINLFAVSVPVKGRARPQNLLGAIDGGGALQSFTLSATCEPVVLTANTVPCASDVVNGRYEVSAGTLAAHFENAPDAAGGFTATAITPEKSGTYYTRYSFSATKEIFT